MEHTNRDMGAIRKWLRVLLAVHIVMLSFSALCNVISFGKLYNWINAALDVAVIFCLLMGKPALQAGRGADDCQYSGQSDRYAYDYLLFVVFLQRT